MPEASSNQPANVVAFNRLAPDQSERLALLAEECGEAVQAIGKVLRHGFASWNNRGDLEKEIGDIFAAALLLVAAYDVNAHNIVGRTQQKIHRLMGRGDLPLVHHQHANTLRAAADAIAFAIDVARGEAPSAANVVADDLPGKGGEGNA